MEWHEGPRHILTRSQGMYDPPQGLHHHLAWWVAHTGAEARAWTLSAVRQYKRAVPNPSIIRMTPAPTLRQQLGCGKRVHGLLLEPQPCRERYLAVVLTGHAVTNRGLHQPGQ